MAIKSSGIKDPSVQISIGALVGGVLIAGLIGYSLIMPRIEDTKAVAAELVERRQDLNKIRNNENKLPALEANVEKLKSELDSLEKFFPDEVDLSGLISQITKVARDEKIFATSFKPLPAATRTYYIENSYDLEVMGSYHNIGRFFARIANFELIVNVSNMKLTSSGSVTKELNEYLADHNSSEEYDNSITTTKATFKITTYSSLPAQKISEQKK